jgi:hypothetical protein
MENDIIRFKKLVKEDKENRKINKERIVNGFHFMQEPTYNFCLAYQPNWPIVMLNGPMKLITLDQEDIEYFKNKYFPKLEKEMNNKIEEIKKEYKEK